MPEQHATTVKESLSRNVIVDVAARMGYLLTRFFIPPFVLAHVSLEAYGLWSAAFIVVSYAVNIFHQPRIPDSGAAFFDMVHEPAV